MNSIPTRENIQICLNSLGGEEKLIGAINPETGEAIVSIFCLCGRQTAKPHSPNPLEGISPPSEALENSLSWRPRKL